MLMPVTHLLVRGNDELRCGSRAIGSRAVELYPGTDPIGHDRVFVLEHVDPCVHPLPVLTSAYHLNVREGISIVPTDTTDTLEVADVTLWHAARAGRPRNPEREAAVVERMGRRHAD